MAGERPDAAPPEEVCSHHEWDDFGNCKHCPKNRFVGDAPKETSFRSARTPEVEPRICRNCKKAVVSWRDQCNCDSNDDDRDVASPPEVKEE